MHKIAGLLIFILISTIPVQGFELSLNGLQNTFRNGMLTEMLRHFISQFGEGLVMAKKGNLSVPNLDWTWDSFYVDGVIRIMNIRVVGLTDCRVQNLTSSITSMNLALEVEAPIVTVTGTYEVDINFMKIPVHGNGRFTQKFSKIIVGGYGKMHTPTFSSLGSIQVQDLFVRLGGIHSDFEGFPSRDNFGWIVSVIVGLLVSYTGIIVMSTLFIRQFLVRQVHRRISCDQLPLKLGTIT